MTQKTTRIHIKNMVCPRCIEVVEQELKKLGVGVHNVELGHCDIIESSSMDEISDVLVSHGFELLNDTPSILVENIKKEVIQLIREDNEDDSNSNLSSQLELRMGYEYNYMSTVFSRNTDTTLSRYYIEQKIEYAKELLNYNELNASEISYKLGYSSAAHFSNQFKSVTGFSPSEYKKQLKPNRRAIDLIG